MKLSRHRARRVIVAEAAPFFATTYPHDPLNFCFDIGMTPATTDQRRTTYRMEMSLEEARKLYNELGWRLKTIEDRGIPK